MTSTPIVRRANLADRAQLIAFHHALYVTYREEHMDARLGPLYAYRDFREVLREDVDAMLRDSGVIVLIAEADGVARGYITGHIENEPRRMLSRRGVVEDWYVEPQARGQGVGRELFETLASIFREVGCEIVESGTWPFNEQGRRTHEALGFEETEIKYRKRL